MAYAPVADSDSDVDPTDPYNRRAQVFPRLSEEMTARVTGYGRVEALPHSTIIFRRGERSVDFFLVLEGSIEMYDLDDHGIPQVFTTLSRRQFTGELDLFNNRMVLVAARIGEDARVVRVQRADFRRLVTAAPDIGEILMRAFILRRVGLLMHQRGGVVLIGPRHTADTQRLQQFLTRNGYPHRLFDTDADPDAGGFLACFELTREQLPVVILPGDQVLRNPGNRLLADALGITETIGTAVYDVTIAGAGPAGLAAAVYAASEGLKTLVIEGTAPGGQAGTSSKIENYLGFPTGISGQALAGRAQVQAQKFGAQLAISRSAAALDCSGHPYRLKLDDGQWVESRTIVVATGARYRRLAVTNVEKFEGQGIYYAATAMEQQLCNGTEVIVVGGGNSAGQAAVFLSRASAHVHLLVRAPDLAATMSDYLVRRIEQSAKVTLHTRTEITALDGDDRLRRVTWVDRATGTEQIKSIETVFLMIGADPNTEWLKGCLELDDRGFVKTGSAGYGAGLGPYATTRPGVFAIGDVRSGSIKRVAAGVGEGSVVLHSIHQFLHPDPVFLAT